MAPTRKGLYLGIAISFTVAAGGAQAQTNGVMSGSPSPSPSGINGTVTCVGEYLKNGVYKTDYKKTYNVSLANITPAGATITVLNRWGTGVSVDYSFRTLGGPNKGTIGIFDYEPPLVVPGGGPGPLDVTAPDRYSETGSLDFTVTTKRGVPTVSLNGHTEVVAEESSIVGSAITAGCEWKLSGTPLVNPPQ